MTGILRQLPLLDTCQSLNITKNGTRLSRTRDWRCTVRDWRYRSSCWTAGRCHSPRSRLAVRISLSGARFVKMAFHPVETSWKDPHTTSTCVFWKAKKPLIKEKLTPTMHRFQFTLSDPLAAGPWKPGQYVALSFQDELDTGYNHMRDNDPKSLNDDYLRTFTVSSRPDQGKGYMERNLRSRSGKTAT